MIIRKCRRKKKFRSNSTTLASRLPEREATSPPKVWNGVSRSGCVAKAYLLIFGSRVDDVVHQYGEKLSHSSHTGSKCAIRSTTTRQLTDLAGLVYPLSGYRVYDIQNPQLVCSWCFLEMCVDLLDEDGFRLRTSKGVSPCA